jgi:hypothetical protein
MTEIVDKWSAKQGDKVAPKFDLSFETDPSSSRGETGLGKTSDKAGTE